MKEVFMTLAQAAASGVWPAAFALSVIVLAVLGAVVAVYWATMR